MVGVTGFQLATPTTFVRIRYRQRHAAGLEPARPLGHDYQRVHGGTACELMP